MAAVIPLADRTNSNAVWEPSDMQASVLQAAAEIGFHRTIAAVAKKAGVRRENIFYWLKRDNGFKKAWDELPRRMVSRHLPGVIAAQVKRALDGNVSSAKLLLQYAGELQAVAGDQINVTAVHLEVIQRADNYEQFKRIRDAVQGVIDV